ncbi:MAG TPA: hypothetical protein VGC18_11175 [Lacisediminihabitans sp.]|uniref:hypothetical protein n=1 Tax=Lacisediminihabitans sp. TaxID=2787631 RepID=UPI002ED9F0F7
MSDDQQWQPPGRTPPAPPPYPSGQRPSAPPPPPGWTPPPRPGLIPLRPLDLGAILGGAFRVLRHNPRPTLGAALILQGITSLLGIGFVGLTTFLSLSRIGSSTQQDSETITAGATGLIIVAALIPALLSVIASAVLQGIVVLEVSRGAVGEKLTFRALWARARGRLGALIGWAFLLVLALVVGVGAVAALIAFFVVTAGTAGIVIGVLLGLLCGAGILVLCAWLGTKLSLVPSALMIERLRLPEAMGRSWGLTTTSFWKTFGIQALVGVIVGGASQVVSIPLGILGPMFIGLLDPNGQGGPTTIAVVGGFGLLSFIVTVLFAAIGSVVRSSTTALIYIDLRIRREGLDLELARFVEARQAGDASVPDPFPAGRLARP